jgi:hypothetical protein
MKQPGNWPSRFIKGMVIFGLSNSFGNRGSRNEQVVQPLAQGHS